MKKRFETPLQAVRAIVAHRRRVLTPLRVIVLASSLLAGGSFALGSELAWVMHRHALAAPSCIPTRLVIAGSQGRQVPALLRSSFYLKNPILMNLVILFVASAYWSVHKGGATEAGEGTVAGDIEDIRP